MKGEEVTGQHGQLGITGHIIAIELRRETLYEVFRNQTGLASSFIQNDQRKVAETSAVVCPDWTDHN